MFFLIVANGKCGPYVKFFAVCLALTITLGIAAVWGGVSGVMVGAGFSWSQTGSLN